MYASIVLPVNLKPLTYEIPSNLVDSINIGTPVLVPLRKKRITGYVCKINNKSKDVSSYEIKKILDIDTEGKALYKDFLEFLMWVSEYYHYPLGKLIHLSLRLKSKPKKEKVYALTRKAEKITEKEIFLKWSEKRRSLINYFLEEGGEVRKIPTQYRNVFYALKKSSYLKVYQKKSSPCFLTPKSFPHTERITHLNWEQEIAFQEINKAICSNKRDAFLLHGVTGSGKTEVYLSAAEMALAKGRNVLALVPEISLTPQLFSRFRSRLGSKVVMFHSSLSHKEKSDQWSLVNSGEAKIVLGTRSCIFLPLKNIGLIIVDEEHESSFKQEDHLRYNAKNVALVRAKIENSVIILSSATPSIESFHQSLLGKLKKINLNRKAYGNFISNIEIIDMKKEKSKTIFSSRLLYHIRKKLEKGQQSILFLNRRGYASYILCKDCGNSFDCPACSVSLTYYKNNTSLKCHYCSYEEEVSKTCKNCKSENLDIGAFGTELVELKLKEAFPQAKILRVDRERIKNTKDLEKSLRQISENKVDIIIGTQMIAKGHDFPNISLVAILNADGSLNIPDFRATERSFQIFTQVSGRAGRRKEDATILLQAYNTNNSAIQHFKNSNYDAFAREELSQRLKFNYPPYCRIARILITDSMDERAFLCSQKIKKLIQKIASEVEKAEEKKRNFEVLGPSPSIIHKLKGKYRWVILVKSPTATQLNSLLKTTLNYCKPTLSKTSSVHIDIDPHSLI